MTLPTTIILPKPKGTFDDNPQTYLSDLVFELQDMYQSMSQNINGNFRNSFEIDSEKWTPLLKGTTSAGSFTYTNQFGWVLRTGLMTEVWFDVSWTAIGGATGNLYLELPYLVTRSSGKPFIGVLQSSTISYGAGTMATCNAIPNTYRLEFWSSGSGVTTANIAISATGNVIGYIRYIGADDE